MEEDVLCLCGREKLREDEGKVGGEGGKGGGRRGGKEEGEEEQREKGCRKRGVEQRIFQILKYLY